MDVWWELGSGKRSGGVAITRRQSKTEGCSGNLFCCVVDIYNDLNAGGIDNQSRSSNLSRRPSPQETVGIYDLFAGDKDDFLSGDEVNDLEGEMTATITEISIPNRTCQRL